MSDPHESPCNCPAGDIGIEAEVLAERAAPARLPARPAEVAELEMQHSRDMDALLKQLHDDWDAADQAYADQKTRLLADHGKAVLRLTMAHERRLAKLRGEGDASDIDKPAGDPEAIAPTLREDHRGRSLSEAIRESREGDNRREWREQRELAGSYVVREDDGGDDVPGLTGGMGI